MDPLTTKQTPLQPATADRVLYLYPQASRGKRFLNMIIDTITFYGIVLGIGFAAGFASVYYPPALEIFEGLQGYLVVYGIYGAYYITMELTIGRTLGKILTNTRVFTQQDTPPTFGQILGRTAARLIPFEPFSFLGSTGSGWHDSLSKTKVVDTSKPPNVLPQSTTLRQALPTPPQSPPESS